MLVALRVAAIVVGALALTVIVWSGFHLSLSAFVQGVLPQGGLNFLSGLDDAVRSRGVAIEQSASLGPSWQYPIIPVWLYYASYARTYWSFDSIVSGIFAFAWGSLVAFFAAGLAETNAVSDTGIAWWTIASLIVFSLGATAWVAAFYRAEGEAWIAAFVPRAILSVVLLGAVVLVSAVIVMFVHPEHSPGLAFLAVTAVLIALLHLAIGASDRVGDGATGWERFLDDPDARTGFDMLAAMGVASLIVAIGIVPI